MNQLKKGLAHHQQGDLAKARACYESVLKMQPRNFHALKLSGVIAAQAQEYEKAFSLLHAAVEVNDKDSELLNNYGVVQRELGRF